MKKTILTFLAIIPLFVFAQKGSYVLKLSSVEIDGVNKGSISIDSIKPSKLVTYVSNYKDSLINMDFTYSSESIPFELTNQTKKSLKVIWNEAAYINYKNTSGKIMHVGVKYIDRSGEQPSTLIIGGTKISDLATPTENVYYSSGTYGGWRKYPLLPSLSKNDPKTLKGGNVKLLLPIQSEGKQYDYVFTFDILFNEYTK